LNNAVVRTAKAYNEDSTKSKLADWQAAEAALADEVARIESRPEPSAELDLSSWEPTKNKAEIYRRLIAAGIDIKRSTLYHHCKTGDLALDKGKYTAAAIRRYLQAQGLLPSPGEESAEQQIPASLQEQKYVAEIRRLRAECKLKELKLEVETGKYIRVDDAYAELAGRYLVLDSGLDYMIQSKAAEFIALVGGNLDRMPDLVKAMTDEKTSLLSEYARAEFIIEGQ
jgi:hypothetical protein